MMLNSILMLLVFALPLIYRQHIPVPTLFLLAVIVVMFVPTEKWLLKGLATTLLLVLILAGYFTDLLPRTF